MTLPAQADIVERLLDRAKRMNGALVGASDGGTYALGYYDQFAAADDKEAADTISRLTADNEALRKENAELLTRDDPAFTYSFKVRAEKVEARADALAQEVEKLRIAVVDYLREHDNPAPDYAYRHQLRERLRAALGDRP